MSKKRKNEFMTGYEDPAPWKELETQLYFTDFYGVKEDRFLNEELGTKNIQVLLQNDQIVNEVLNFEWEEWENLPTPQMAENEEQFDLSELASLLDEE